MNPSITHTTSGNVFEDLGFSREEATAFALKTDLMVELEHVMRREKLNVALAAKRFGVKAPVIQRLKKGDLEFFSVDMLIQMLERAGKQVSVIVSDKKRIKAA